MLATWPVSVATPGGVVITVDVPEMCTVLQLKKMLAAKCGTAAIDLHVVHGVKTLVAGEVQQWGVASGTTLTRITDDLRGDCVR